MLPECQHREVNGIAQGLHKCNYPGMMRPERGVDDGFCTDRCSAFFRTGTPEVYTPKIPLPTVAATPQKHVKLKCGRLGKATGELINCPECGGGIELKVFECEVFGLCTVGRDVRASTNWRIKGFCANGHCPAFLATVVDEKESD